MQQSQRRYARHYSESGFWAKIQKCAKAVDRQTTRTALSLHYAFQDPASPLWVKAVCVGALGYLICPLDAIPDAFLPLGYVDDVAVLSAALASIALHISPRAKANADEKLRQWTETA